MLGKTVQFSIRLEDMTTAARSISFDQYINDRDSILERVMGLYSEFEGESGVTFISVTLSNLKPQEEVVEQLDLFTIDRSLSTNDIINQLNEEIKGNVFKSANKLLLQKGDHHESSS